MSPLEALGYGLGTLIGGIVLTSLKLLAHGVEWVER